MTSATITARLNRARIRMRVKTFLADLFHLIAALLIGACLAAACGLIFAFIGISQDASQPMVWFYTGVGFAIVCIVALGVWDRRA